MHTHSIFSAIIVGLIIGALGRLFAKGRQSIGIIVTIVLGLVAAFVGGAIGDHIGNGRHFVITLIIQVALAVVLVGAVGGTLRSRARR